MNNPIRNLNPKFASLFVVISFCVFLGKISYAADETITITTYYPSPNGSYNRLQANRMAIGQGNDAGVIGDGVLDFTPLSTAPAGNAGSLYYDDNTDKFLYHDGTAWKEFVPPSQLVQYNQVVGATAGVTNCPTGTHVAAVFTTGKIGANLGSPPVDGYMLCVK